MYIRDPHIIGVRNHDDQHHDVTIDALNTDQIIPTADQQRRWYDRTSADNCSDGRPKRQRTETGHFNADSGVSASWGRNLTRAGANTSRYDCPDITVPEKSRVTDSQHQVAYALHWASTVILGLLVLEVSYYSRI